MEDKIKNKSEYMKEYNKLRDKKAKKNCLDCEKLVGRRSIRCYSCANKNNYWNMSRKNKIERMKKIVLKKRKKLDVKKIKWLYVSKNKPLEYIDKKFGVSIVIIRKRLLEEKVSMKNTSHYDMKVSEETKKKLKLIMNSKKIKRRLSKKSSGKNNPMFGKRLTKEQIKKMVETKRRNGDYEKASERMINGDALKSRKFNRFKPNKPEKVMINLFKENDLPFNYVGDGKIWFRGQNSAFNPDFLSKNPKHIIELFGDYWHRNTKKRDKERLKTYSKYGYKTLVIWEHELKNHNKVINKIRNFVNNKEDDYLNKTSKNPKLYKI